MSYENSSLAFKTDSSLSEWVGPSTITAGHPVSQVRQPGGYAPFDTFDWMTREINLTALSPTALEFVPVGPASTAVHSFAPIDSLKEWIPFKNVMTNFYGFSYDSIQVRVTINNPKGIVGGLFAGWFPYHDYYDEDIAGTIGCWIDGNANNRAFLNSTDCQFFSFGDAQDVTMTIPWTFKYPMYKTKWLQTRNVGTQNGRPPTGVPVIYVQNYSSTYVNSITKPAQLQIFIKYEGLKLYGPTILQNFVAAQDPKRPRKPPLPPYDPTQPESFDPQSDPFDPNMDFDPQSDGGVLEAAAVGALMEAGISKMSDMVTPFSDAPATSISLPTPEPGNFDNPSAVQMSYFGDITTRGNPQVRPVFIPRLPPPSTPNDLSVKKYLSRPAFVTAGSTSGGVALDVHPTASYDYMNYFAMVNRYWRGVINYHVYVTSMPMVQCKFTATINYLDGASSNNLNRFNSYDTLQETFYGSKTFTIPAPFLTNADYLPIADPTMPTHITNRSVSCLVEFKLEVVSTMLDVDPTIPFFVFRTAGDDFSLFQPYPPGLYYSPDVIPPPLDPQINPFDPGMTFDAQIGLPTFDHTVMTSRHQPTVDPGTLTPFTDFMDLMQIWSRSVPFKDYNNTLSNEEPIPDVTAGFDGPCWWPPVDRARHYEANNSWYFTVDYVHYLSILFLYWRGSIAAKVTYNPLIRGESNKASVLYVSLASDLTLRSPSHCAFGHDYESLPPIANFGTGTFATSTELQPVLECSIPMRATTTWSNCIPQTIKRGVAREDDEYPSGVYTNILLYNESSNKLADQFARKVDSDFALAVEAPLPPVQFWMQRGSTG